jgi:hypothetical protein
VGAEVAVVEVVAMVQEATAATVVTMVPEAVVEVLV